MPCHRICCATAIVLSIYLNCGTRGRCEVPITNASFEQGESAPTDWSLNQGSGALISPGAVGRRAISVTGDGKSDNAWISSPLPLSVNSVYRLQFQARRMSGAGGLAVTGPLFCNRDLSGLGDKWTPFESFFVTPKQPAGDAIRLRFGQWQAPGQIAFDDVRLDRVVPVYQSVGDVRLGSGEIVKHGRYTFNAPYGQASANQSRPLAWQQCHFNSNRWSLSSPNTCVIYRHHIGRSLRRVSIQADVGWYRHGELLIEVSGDGARWQELGTIVESGTGAFEVPDELLPADELWVRFSARKKAGEKETAALQLNAYRFEAELSGAVPDLVGTTHFLSVRQEDPQLEVSILGMGDAVPGGRNVVDVQIRNVTDHPLTLDTATIARPTPDNADTSRSVAAQPHHLTLADGATSPVLPLPYELTGVAAHRLQVTVSGDASFVAETTIEVPALHAAHYGESLPGTTDSLALWWCSSGWKISSQRPVPKQKGTAIVIRAAANETEAAQLVLRPSKPISDLTLQASDLAGPDNTMIAAEAIEFHRVGYVHVTQPTDATGTVGLWPDPLPPLRANEQVAANRNFPLWVKVHVPSGQAAGMYRGTILLHGKDCNASIPLHVDVFGFELPKRMTCKTAFGLDTSAIWRYHGLSSEPARRAVLAKYHQCLAEHHISPYQPAPLDPIHVTWKNTPRWSGGERDATVQHTGDYSLKVADDSTTASASATYLPKIAIPAQGLNLRLWHRAAKAEQPFIVTLQHYDADGRWMSGRNNDVRIDGTDSWQEFQRSIQRFPQGAQSVQLHLRATLWSEAGTATGTVWFDAVSLTAMTSNGQGNDQDKGLQLISEGGFESQELPIPVPEFDFSRWDRAMTEAIDQRHFNSFRLGVPGLGGGTFHARYEPELLGYSEDTPQYQGAMKAYLGLLQKHLQEKGWLDEAFVYWFDEPDPKDYAFVTRGFDKLKRWAPEIPRMLTEQVEPGLVGGPNIWCPVTSSYDHEDAETRRKAGEDFWWYVCTGPKAPYCTLFIDHPGTEMRVWLWQTWQRNISGILVWQSNYWTSSAAYPDRARPQDPYADPMGWVSGYSTPSGTRRKWGNGDGRFLYPPEAAANGRPAKPVLDEPVASIRLEMLRDGIEDYEYLCILRRLLRQHHRQLSEAERSKYRQLLTVPPEITADMTTFTTDPEPIEARRRAVAAAIEALSK